MPDELVPIGLLAAENFNVDTVARQHADQVVINSAGLRCLPASVVRELIAERDQRREAERQRVATAQPRPHPVRERVRAIQARQAGGCADPDTPALAVMKAGDRI